ncbi:MAG: J domain-containing protein [Sulfuricurvum sp.]|jgi:DnaJ-class molecular chaperone
MEYKELQNALEVLDITTRFSHAELKDRYKKLSKIYHPDVEGGDEAKFVQILGAYKLLEAYIKGFRYSFSEEEFYAQKPFLKFSSEWF